MSDALGWIIGSGILAYLIAELVVGDKELREKGTAAEDGLILPVRLIEFLIRKLRREVK